MKKGLIVNNEKMGKYEIEKGFASYRTIINYFVGDIVLCNNIAEIEPNIYENIENVEDFDTLEIYQYYLCNVSEWKKEQLLKCGVILSYSDMLECDVLCVDHFGTSWDYVLTNVKLFDNCEDLEKYENDEVA